MISGLKPLIELPIKHVSKLSSYSNVPALRLFQHNTNPIISLCGQRSFSSLMIQPMTLTQTTSPRLLKAQSDVSIEPSRSVTKFSRKKGKRKACKTVVRRFYRLHWGMWIRPRAGRHRKMWKKSGALKRRLKDHVFTNSTQSWLLDKMTTNFWRKPRYWPDNIYEPYNTREEFYITRTKPHDPDEVEPKKAAKKSKWMLLNW